MNKEELQIAHDQLREELLKLKANLEKEVSERDARIVELNGQLEIARLDLSNVRVSREELENRFEDLRRTNAELEGEISQRHALFPAEEIERAILAKIQGAEIQRLFHNPTAPAMRQAASQITAALKIL